MTEFVRTADEHFANLRGFSFAPNYHHWQDLRMHYLDEGPKDGPVTVSYTHLTLPTICSV